MPAWTYPLKLIPNFLKNSIYRSITAGFHHLRILKILQNLQYSNESAACKQQLSAIQHINPKIYFRKPRAHFHTTIPQSQSQMLAHEIWSHSTLINSHRQFYSYVKFTKWGCVKRVAINLQECWMVMVIKMIVMKQLYLVIKLEMLAK